MAGYHAPLDIAGDLMSGSYQDNGQRPAVTDEEELIMGESKRRCAGYRSVAGA